MFWCPSCQGFFIFLAKHLVRDQSLTPKNAILTTPKQCRWENWQIWISITVPVPWEITLCVITAHYYYTPYIYKQRKPHIIWRDVGGHNSKYADLWSLTYHQHYRTGNGQEYWQANLMTITIANTLTFIDSLINSTTTHWNRTRVLAGQIWTHDLGSLTYLPGTREASTGSDKTIGRCTNERGAKHCPKLGGSRHPKT